MIGKLRREVGGPIFETDKVIVIRYEKKVGEDIAKHNHPNADIYITLLSGQLEVTFNDIEKHQLNSGDVLNFNGNDSVAVKIIKDSQMQVTVIKL